MKLAACYLTLYIVFDIIVLHTQVGGYNSDVGFYDWSLFDCCSTVYYFCYYPTRHTLGYQSPGLLSQHISQIMYYNKSNQLPR